MTLLLLFCCAVVFEEATKVLAHHQIGVCMRTTVKVQCEIRELH